MQKKQYICRLKRVLHLIIDYYKLKNKYEKRI